MSSRLRSTSKKDAKGKVKSSKNIKQKVSINTLEASTTAATSEAQTEQVRVHNQSIIGYGLPDHAPDTALDNESVITDTATAGSSGTQQQVGITPAAVAAAIAASQIPSTTAQNTALQTTLLLLVSQLSKNKPSKVGPKFDGKREHFHTFLEQLEAHLNELQL